MGAGRILTPKSDFFGGFNVTIKQACHHFTSSSCLLPKIFRMQSSLPWPVAFIGLWAVFVSTSAGDISCRLSDRGKMSTFSNDKVYVQIPCKYQATTFVCQGYKVHVSPGMALDSKARYFTDTMWVSFTSLTTPDYWRGRISTGRVERFFNGSLEGGRAYKTRGEERGAGMVVEETQDETQFSVTLRVNGTRDLAVRFYAYDEKNKNRRKRNGYRITCGGEATFDIQGQYPESICGNNTNKKAVRLQEKALDMSSRTDTIIHDVLAKGLEAQTNPQCEIAVHAFQECGAQASMAVTQCAPLLTKTNIRKCLTKAYRHPMDAFIFCLRTVCNSDADACSLFQESMEGCPKNKNLPTGPCQ